MTVQVLQLILAIVALAVPGIIWQVRLEGRINANKLAQDAKNEALEKELTRLEKQIQDLVHNNLEASKETSAAINKLSLNMERVLERIEHMNRKVINFEAGKMAPIIEEYIKKHGEDM